MTNIYGNKALLATVFFLISGLVVFPNEVRAATCKWNVSGRWNAEQSNGFRVIFRLSQKMDDTVSGTAEERTIGKANVSGHVAGNTVFLNVYWPGYKIGRYDGAISSTGHIEKGQTCDAMKHNCANWYSSARMKVQCF